MDPLSSEAMYLKHKETVDAYHEELRKAKRSHKAKPKHEAIVTYGVFKVNYEWEDGMDTTFGWDMSKIEPCLK